MTLTYNTLEDYRPSIEQAFLHFFHHDHANAAIHLSEVRYSPITFKLAGAVKAGDGPWRPEAMLAADEVIGHSGGYTPDPGRAAADPAVRS